MGEGFITAPGHQWFEREGKDFSTLTTNDGLGVGNYLCPLTTDDLGEVIYCH